MSNYTFVSKSVLPVEALSQCYCATQKSSKVRHSYELIYDHNKFLQVIYRFPKSQSFERCFRAEDEPEGRCPLVSGY
jgi:hypothetical protein